MKKIGTAINILVIIILLCLLGILFGPMLLPNTVVDIMENHIDTSKPYKTELVMMLSSKDSDLMEDIYIQDTFKVNNEFQEIYNFMELNLGGESFQWKRLFNNNKLQERNPFDGRSIEFSDINDVGIKKPESEGLPFLYQFVNENRQNWLPSQKIYGRDPHESGNFFDKFRIYYTYEAESDKATQLFKNFIGSLKSSNSYESFFIESHQIEQKLSMQDGVSELDKIVNMLGENTTVDKLSIKYYISMNVIENIELEAELKYIVNNQPISMTLYISQNFEYIEEDQVSEDVYFTSLVNIKDLAPDTITEDITSDVGMIENPVDGGSVPGLILSDEVKNGRGEQ